MVVSMRLFITILNKVGMVVAFIMLLFCIDDVMRYKPLSFGAIFRVYAALFMLYFFTYSDSKED
jgi:hypothetical protein